MANSPGPLHKAAEFFNFASVKFLILATQIDGIPIIGEYLSDPFYWVGYHLYFAGYYLDEADAWISSLNVDTFILSLTDWVMEKVGASLSERLVFYGHFTAWIMTRLGFNMLEAFLFEMNPELWLRWKLATWFDFLDPIFNDPFGWIREKIIENIPALGYLFEDPAGWVLYMLGVPWWERFFWSDHLLAWLLHRWGLDIADALMFEADPIFWVKYQVLKRWDFLDDLLLDPPSWIWDKFTQAVDRYIDVNLDWLVTTAARVLNTIWQTRI